MISRKTFIITIVAICAVFIAILGIATWYHFDTVNELKKETKPSITLVQNSEATGLENVIVE